MTGGVLAPASHVNNTGYTVSWNAVTDGHLYQLQSRFNGGNWTTVQDSSQRTRRLQRGRLRPLVRHQVGVRAADGRLPADRPLQRARRAPHRPARGMVR